MSEPIRLNLLFFGSENSGKTCLIRRIVSNKFPSKREQTIGVDFCTWPFQLDVVDKEKSSSLHVILQFFDLGGNDFYKLVRTEFYKPDASIHASLLCFDTSNRASFESLNSWYQEAQINGLASSEMMIPIILCGCKSDQLPRTVTYEEAKEWAKLHSITYYETSASIGIGHIELVTILASEAYKRYLCTSKYILHMN